MVGASSSIFGCSSSWRKYGGAIEGETQKKKKKKKTKKKHCRTSMANYDLSSKNRGTQKRTPK